MSKVLIIDDDTASRKFVVMAARSLADTVLEARDGIEGLSITAKELPDLIICDHMMPQMGGLETIRTIRGDSELKRIPVIIITSTTDKKVVLDYLQLGISYFFAKPLNFELLRKKIQQVLEFEASKNKSVNQGKNNSELRIGKPRIIICEPNDNLRETATEALTNDFEVIALKDGASCLNEITKVKPDAVLIEPEMRFFSGIEVASKIKSTPALEKIKVIFFTTKGKTEDMQEYKEYVDSFIEKPYTQQNLAEIVTETLDLHYIILENEKNIQLKFNSRCREWVRQNGEQVMKEMDHIILHAFESGKDSMILDLCNITEHNEECSEFIKAISEKAGKHNITITVSNEYGNIAGDKTEDKKVAGTA